MRNLTVKRNKSFVASVMRMNVYIEDPSSEDITLNGLSCRRLGSLKNGEEKTFTIDENEARIFIIADKLSKGYCNDYCKIQEGREDISLSGKNCFNLATGNAFRFDGITDGEVLKNRKKSMKIGLAILIAAIVVGIVVGAAIGTIFTKGGLTAGSKPKEFSSKGMRITLTDQFKESTEEGFTACYDSGDVAVFALKEDFSMLNGLENYTVWEYGAAVLEHNGFSLEVQLETREGLTCYERLSTGDDGVTYHNLTVLYKSSDSFWIIQFVTREKSFDKYEQTIVDWAKSVAFAS